MTNRQGPLCPKVRANDQPLLHRGGPPVPSRSRGHLAHLFVLFPRQIVFGNCVVFFLPPCRYAPLPPRLKNWPEHWPCRTWNRMFQGRTGTENPSYNEEAAFSSIHHPQFTIHDPPSFPISSLVRQRDRVLEAFMNENAKIRTPGSGFALITDQSCIPPKPDRSFNKTVG